MAEHVWSVLCESSVVDSETNRLSLFNNLESVSLLTTEEELERQLAEQEAGHGALPIALHLASYWVRTDVEEPEEEFSSRIRMHMPNGDAVLASGITKVRLTEHHGFRTRMNIKGFRYGGVGRYWFEVCRGVGEDQSTDPEDWEGVARVPLLVKLEPPK